MTFREWLILVHVLTAILWMGGGVLLVLLGYRTLRRGNADANTAYIRDSEFAGMLFGIASALLLGSGIWLVIEVNGWEFDQAWILVSLILTGTMFVIGAGYHAPQVKQRVASAVEKGGAHPDVVGDVRRWLRTASVEIAVMAFVVWLMVDKPWL
jgi:uncharacterized membrane protein